MSIFPFLKVITFLYQITLAWMYCHIMCIQCKYGFRSVIKASFRFIESCLRLTIGHVNATFSLVNIVVFTILITRIL